MFKSDGIAKPSSDRAGCAPGLPAPIASATTRICARGETIPMALVTDEAHGVLDRGILLLDLSSHGRSFALDFIFPGEALLPFMQLVEGRSGMIGFTAIEECALQIWSRAAIETTCGSNAWIALQRRLADRAIRRNGQRFLSLLTRSAAERYRDMHDEFPEAWRRLPQHLVASYLGVTPQYLCQLKRGEARHEKPPQPETS